ncbi:ATP-dependent RecD-like DNA helicase [Pontiella desulfatans]|uniref:ATP-dependent RecD-like DNA helicase n=2 Tax=Pontiella desulfatans TaxID=2750659 RepID=A0A6C2U3Z4_PONDE|nr:ATP-dependent RecD-like DNA helicase [Pontiella desulfatans]
MTLTPQQEQAISKLSEFFKSSERCFILKGYAGTGKTFLLGHLAESLASRSKEVWLLAPTGRAARVLSRKTGYSASTIHRATYDLKELVEHDDETASFKFYFRTKDVTTDNLDVVVFVDEASMVSDKHSEGEFIRFGSGRLLSDLIHILRLKEPTQKTKLVLVGDPAQLPPVNSATSPALDANYLFREHGISAREYELKEVVRQKSESPILREATAIRNTLASEFHNCLCIKPAPPCIESIQQPDLPSRYIEANSGARLPRAICIAYTNATCLNLNVAVRSNLFGGDGMQAAASSDVLMVIRNSPSTGLLNGDLVSVLWADEEPEEVPVRVGTELVSIRFRNIRILAESEDGSDIQIGTKIVENLLFSEKRDLSPVEQKALYVHFKMRYPKLRSNTKEFAQALQADPYFNALQVKFGYAVTCHKAQGGEWDDVFVYFEHARTDALSLRWAYTALTRAKSRLFGVNLPDRQPWANAVVNDGNVSCDVTPVAEDIAATKWDGLFPEEPPFLLAQHRRMVAALDGAGITIESVEVRANNYYWRYVACRDSARSTLNVWFKNNGELKPAILPRAGMDEVLGKEALLCLQLHHLPVMPHEEAIEFPSGKPFLRAFYDECMMPRAQAIGAKILRVDHNDYQEKYHVSKGACVATIVVYYDKDGKIGNCRLESGGQRLFDEMMRDT